MNSLISFWQAKLREHGWLMSQTDRAMIKDTIKSLQELKRSKVQSQVQREADIVRTVKELSERPSGKGVR